MKIIVTGANGFIGTSLIKKYVSTGNEVLAIDVKFGDDPVFNNKLVRKIITNINDINDLCDSISYGEYDLFYHFAWAGVNGVEKSNYRSQINNIKLTLDCADFSSKVGCKKFLCAGTITERNILSLNKIEKTGASMFYGSAKHSTHLLLETFCKYIDMPFVWMQFSNIYGPNNKTGNLISYTLSQLFNNKSAEFGPADQPYDFIYIDDLIEAIYLLGIKNTKNSFYYIGSGEPRLLKDYLLEIGNITKKENYIKIGVRESDGIKYSFDMFDVSELTNDIGKYTSVSFSEGIKITIDNF